MDVGIKMRMHRLFQKDSGNCLCIAADHGGIAGPVEGIEKPGRLIRECIAGGADAILTTRGFVRAAVDDWDRSIALVLRLTGGFTILGGMFEEEIISSPQAALEYGASAAAVTVKFGHPREGEFIRNASLAADQCRRWGLPVMIESMVKKTGSSAADPEGIKLAARAAMEIGADIVKTFYTGDVDSFGKVVEGCSVPILILGGEKNGGIEEVFRDVHDSIEAGAKGIAIGRNIWQHKNTKAAVEAMAGIVHEKWTVGQALQHIT